MTGVYIWAASVRRSANEGNARRSVSSRGLLPPVEPKSDHIARGRADAAEGSHRRRGVRAATPRSGCIRLGPAGF